MKKISNSLNLLCGALQIRNFSAIFLTLAFVTSAQAATSTWNTTTGTWSAPASWSGTDTPPLAGDTAAFNGSAAFTANLNGTNTTITGITGSNTSTTTIQNGSATAASLTIGSGGITIANGSGTFTLGGTGTNTMNVNLSASQTWTNGTGSLLVVSNGITNSAASTPVTLTINGSGPLMLNGTISDGVGTSTTSLTFNSSNSGTTTLAGANTYTGTTTFSNFGAAGTIIISGTNSSAGAVILGSGAGYQVDLDNASNGGIASGTLTLTGGNIQSLLASQTLSNAVVVNGTQTNFNGSNSITLAGSVSNVGNSSLTNSITGGRLTISGSVNLDQVTGTAQTLTFGGSSTSVTVISGVIQDYSGGVGTVGGNLTFNPTNSGTPTLILAGANTYTGTTTLSGGILQLDNASNGGLGSSKLLINGNGGTLQSLLPSQTVSNAITLSQGLTVSGANSIILTGGINVVNSPTITSNISGANSLTISTGTVNLDQVTGTAQTLSINSSGFTIVSSPIQDFSGGLGTVGGNLSSGGFGYLTISGSNAFGGATGGTAGTLSISNGTVILAGANSSPIGKTTLNNGALWFDNANDGGLAGGILTLGGGTVQSLLASQTITNSGTMSGSVIFTGANSIIMTGGLADTGANLTLTNNMTSAVTGNSLTFSTGVVTLDQVTGTAQTLTIAGSGNTTISSAIKDISTGLGTNGANLTITNTGTTTLSGANSFGGSTTAGTLTVNGAGGTVILAGTNSSTIGNTTLTAGTLQLDNATDGGLAGGILNFNGGTLQSLLASQAVSNSGTFAASSTISGTQSISLNGTYTQSASTTLTNNISGSGRQLTLAGTVNIDNATGTGQTLTLAGAGNTTISGVIQDYSGGTGTSHGAVTFSGTGVTTLSGSNTFGGVVTISAGTVLLNAAQASASSVGVLGQDSGAGSIILSGGTLEYSSANQTDYSSRFSTGNVASSGLYNINTNGQNVTFGTALANTGTGNELTLNDTAGTTGTLTLTSATNAYTGTTTITAGTLKIGGAGLLGSGAYAGNIVMGNSGVFNYNSSANQTLSGVVSGTGALVENGAGTLILSNANTFTGSTTIVAGAVQLNNANALQNSTVTISATNGLTFNTGITAFTIGGLSGASNDSLINTGSTAVTLTAGNNNANTTYSGVLSGTSAGLTKTGSGTLTLAGANLYNGATTVNVGTLQVGNGTSGSIAATSALVMGGGIFDLVGNTSGVTSQTIASLATTAKTVGSVIMLNPNGGTSTTLTITSPTVSIGAGSGLNFNLSLGTTNASTSTLGNTVVAWNPSLTGGIIGAGYTVTDLGGTGFATVVGGDVVRLSDSGTAGLPVATGSATGNYFINQNYSTTSTTTPGSLVEALSGATAANTITVDTTGLTSGAQLVLGANKLIITAGGGFVFNGANPYLISATSGGITTSSTTGSIFFNNYGTGGVTISAPILTFASGTNPVAFNGTGTTILTGANTYTGGTVIGVGATVQVGNGGSTGNLGTGGVTDNGSLVYDTTTSLSDSNAITDNGSVTNIGVGNLNLNGIISGTGSVTQSSASTMTLNGVNTFTGGLIDGKGTVILNNAASAGTGTITLGSSTGGSATLGTASTGNGFTITNNIVLGTGAVGTLTLTNNAFNSPTYAGTSAINLNGDNLTLLASGNNYGLTISSGFIGAGNLTLNSGAAFDYGQYNTFLNITTGTVNNIGTITNSGTFNGPSTISAAVGSNVTGIIENSVVTAGNAPSVLTLSGANANYGGSTTLTAGWLQLNSATALGGNGSATGVGGSLTVAAGTYLDGNSTMTTVNAENWNGSFTFLGSAGNLGTGAGTITLAAPLTLTVGQNTLTVAGNITDAAHPTSAVLDITKAGPGTFTDSSNIVLNGNQTVTVTGGVDNMSGIISDGGNNYGLTVQGGGEFFMSGGASFTGTLTVTGGSSLYFGTGGSLSNTNIVLNNATFDYSAVARVLPA